MKLEFMHYENITVGLIFCALVWVGSTDQYFTWCGRGKGSEEAMELVGLPRLHRQPPVWGHQVR